MRTRSVPWNRAAGKNSDVGSAGRVGQGDSGFGAT